MFLTSDWHRGEAPTANTHSYLRPHPTDVLTDEWLRECHLRINPEDTLVFLGDLAITLEDLKFYTLLPKCAKLLILGDKEYGNKNFTEQEFLDTNAELRIFDYCTRNRVLEVAGRDYFLSHKPLDCLRQDLPAICGHVHGIWRSARMPNRQPIINVGIDAWGGLVSEEFIEHQYTSITDHYDLNAFPAKWASVTA